MITRALWRSVILSFGLRSIAAQYAATSAATLNPAAPAVKSGKRMRIAGELLSASDQRGS
jgi:hypothetical protein